MHSIQKPTLQNCRLRSTRDADSIFLAVAENRLPLITRRLDAAERSRVVSGNCYVWEQRSAMEASGLGMERWTDGMGWGPSRVRDEFLYYHQKEPGTLESHQQPWAQITSPSANRVAGSERLIKQTYSVEVTLPTNKSKCARKWHLTAYYSQQTMDGLRDVQDISGVGGMEVPQGWFKSTRATKSRRERSESNQGSSGGIPPIPPAVRMGSGIPSYPPSDAPARPARSRHQDLFFGPPSYPALSPPPFTRPPNLRVSSHPIQRHVERRASSPSPTPSDQSNGSSSSMGTDADAVRSDPSRNEALIAGKRSERLVPLNYLQNIAYPRREPTDEQFLRLFSTQASFPIGL